MTYFTKIRLKFETKQYIALMENEIKMKIIVLLANFRSTYIALCGPFSKN